MAVVIPRLAGAVCDVAQIGSIALGTRIRDVEVVGNLAYIAAGFDGLRIVDVSDPQAPVLVGALDSPAFSQDVAVVGSTAYLADSSFLGPGGLRIIDVSNPGAPVEQSFFPSSFNRVAVRGTTAFASGPASGLHAFDVSNPANPVEVGSFDLPGFEGGVTVAGDLAYLPLERAEEDASLRVLDVANPAALSEIGAVETGARLPFDMKVSGNLGYVTAIGRATRGLAIYDVSNPAAPVELSFLKRASSRRLDVLGQRAYFAFGVDISFGGGLAGFRIIDVSDPSIPVDIGGADTAIDEATSIDVQAQPGGDRVFVSTSGVNGGLRIFDVSSCPDVSPVDVIPGSEANWIPMIANDPIPIRIFGSATLDVATIPLGSLRFGRGGAPPMFDAGFAPVLSDVNGDGIPDLVVYFHADEALLEADDQQLCVEGSHAGGAFMGCNWVSVNQPPVPLVFDQPHRPIAPAWVTFFGTASYDPEGSSLSFEWTFDDWADPVVGPTVQQFLPVPGKYKATLTVEDDFGQRRSTTYIAKAREVPVVEALSPRLLFLLAVLILFGGAPLLALRRRA